MRTFIAIELPKEIKHALAHLQDQLKLAGADVKWVEPENIHLTLKFLGEIDEEKLNKTKEILQNSVKDKNAFPLRLSSLGAFPKIKFPRVIWVGVGQGDAETKEIANVLEEKIAPIGIPKEKRAFSTHITLGRVRSALNREKLVESLDSLMESFGKENLQFWVGKITLFKSTLTPGGPVYETLKEVHLKAT